MYFTKTRSSRYMVCESAEDAGNAVPRAGREVSGRAVRHSRGRSRFLDLTSLPAVILGSILVVVTWTALLTPVQAQNVFSNQFALHIPDGDERAAEVAAKYGYTNLGQIGSLTHYYLFEHSKVHKRSVEFSQDHHQHLTDEPHVHWFEQQVEKKRVKRDFPYFEGSSGTGGPYYPTAHSFLPHGSSYNGFVDPLYKEQWYLTGGSKDGYDMNVQTAWKRGYSGKGVTVSILDDGIQTNHPDLMLNYDPRASTDINDNDNDPTPQDNGDNKHGTRCAGEVAATAGNNICGVGVAYNASIGGVRMLDGTVNDAVEAKALGLNPDHVDIYSASWGPEDDGKTVDGPGPLARRAFIYGVTNGRRGLGSIFIWASGNGGRHVDSCNCDGYTNSIFTLSISSATQGGYKPWYLEECASTLATTYSSGTPTLDKSVATVDMDGRLRPDHICTVEHTGTSASAPLAAGIAALALEANRNLSWRDLQHLVVMTSRAGPLEKEEGWYVNGVQRKFSHKFGYGLMDAGAMVDLAVNWAGVPPQHICKSREIREDREIPGSHLGKVKVFMDVDGCASSNSEIRFLEHVQCKISLRFFPRGNLRILLTSPMGTTSVLLFERPRDVASSNFDDWPFLSVHFWGEQAHGRWTLEIINSGSRRINQPGILKKWQLILYGTDVSPVRVRSRSLPIQSHAQQQHHSAFEPPVSQTQRQQYRQVQSGHRYSIPDEYLYPGASENQPQFHKTTSVRAQCQHDFWVPDLAICVNACPEGYFADESFQKECHSCSSRCKSCYNNTSCTACEHNLVLYDTTCLPICPEGFYEADSSCERCPLSTCAACAGAMGNECVRCKEGRVLYQNTCLAACPAGFRPTQFNECMACPTGCLSCDEHQCFKCFNALELSEDATYCTKTSQECPVGLFLDQETKLCSGCGKEECLQCGGPNSCTECKDGFFLLDGDCIPECYDGLYHSFSHKECFACPKLCKKCTTSEDCVECRADGMLQDGKCLPHCSDGFYNDLGVCGPCSAGCKTCIGKGNDECVTCNPGFNYTRGGVCLPSNNAVSKDPVTSSSQEISCLDGYWLSPIENTCLPCHRSCSRCSGGNPYNCRSCVSPLRLDRGSSRCIECCQNTDDQDCCHCDDKRNTQEEETPYTRGYNGECHFVSRRVSESDEREISAGKWSDSAVLSFFWLSVFLVIIIAIVTVQRRRHRRSTSLLSSMDEDFEDFDTKELRINRSSSNKNHRNNDVNKSLYTPVSLNPCDDDGVNDEFINNGGVIGVNRDTQGRSHFISDDEDESIGRAEVAPLVLKT